MLQLQTELYSGCSHFDGHLDSLDYHKIGYDKNDPFMTLAQDIADLCEVKLKFTGNSLLEAEYKGVPIRLTRVFPTDRVDGGKLFKYRCRLTLDTEPEDIAMYPITGSAQNNSFTFSN